MGEVLNFGEAIKRAKNASFDPLPEGTYDVICIEATPTESSTNKPMIRLKYQVESGPNAGSKVFNQQVFSADNDAALAIFFRYMAFHGLDEAFFSANPPWEQVAAALVHRRVRLVLGIRQWQGQDRNEVNQVLPPSVPDAGAAATPPPAQTPPPQLQVPFVPPAVTQTPLAVPPAVPQVEVPAAVVPTAAPPAAEVPAPVEAADDEIARLRAQLAALQGTQAVSTPQQVEQPAAVPTAEQTPPPALPDLPY